jgi:hypothetical protein
MTDDDEPKASREPRRLGAPARFLLAVGLLLAGGLALVTVTEWHRRREAEAKKVAATRKVLDVAAQSIRRNASAARMAGVVDWVDTNNFAVLPTGLARFAELRDAWGGPIHYRCPGPVHAKGWDIWSGGASGNDEPFDREDLLLGEDLAPVASGW